MIGTWLVEGNHLAIHCGNEILHPSAEEIYSALSDDRFFENFGVEVSPLVNAFQGISFSEIGSVLKCILNDDENGNINLKLCCSRQGKEIDVDVIDGQIVDQCILNDEWFYVTGNTEDLESVFSHANIKTAGSITIAQYIELVRNSKKFVEGTLINNVRISAYDKPVNTKGTLPDGLNAQLYEYQKVGYSWMRLMLADNKGCILGDEMGLGKTLQVITLMLEYIHSGKSPLLVIAPVSLLENWKNECKKFAPEMKVLIHHGPHRTGRYADFKNYDLVIISYNTAVSDISILNMVNWPLVVIDEAQNIKNAETNRAKFVKQIKRQSSIAVTGTPFENHVTDIWSIVDFVFPGLFGTLSEYEGYISDDLEGASKVEPILSPIMIRRYVGDVAKDLPERVIIPQPIAMSDEEANNYEQLRVDAGHITNRKEETDPPKFNLSNLQPLRMYCTHPAITGEGGAGVDPAKISVKYQRLCEILENIFAVGEKVILFTSYLKMFDIFEQDIPWRFNVPVLKVNGTTPVDDRQKNIDSFNKIEGSALLVLNPKAAGTGLNITAANHVIHYNLEWNPAVEDQASARAYRRGQGKTVFIYRLYYVNTVEQVINERIERKRNMADKAIVGIDGKDQSEKDIIAALTISPIGGKKYD